MKQVWIRLCAVILFAALSGTAQVCPTYTAISGTIEGSTNFSSGAIIFPVTTKAVAAPLLRERNTSAKLRLKFDVGNDYIKKASGWNFKAVLGLTYQFNGNSAVAKTLTITNTSPEMLKIEDVLPYFVSSSPTLTISVSSITINDGATPTPASLTGLVQNFVNTNIRLTATLVREYEVDVRLQSTNQLANAPVALPVSVPPTGRVVTFSWQPGVTAYPNYEIQVLKVYNVDPSLQTDNNQILALVDWSKALKVETQSWRNSINLTIGEGSGYYVWRVRPIGNYFSGSSGNSENYGNWSYAFPDNSNNLLNKGTLTGANNPYPYAFYFSDPDENTNWIYNRVFTEGDNTNKDNATGVKTSEGMSYADGLLNARQSQSFNSAENRNLVSQTVLDYSGRPALSTLPVPVSGGLNGYKPALVQNSVGVLYTAKDFDSGNTAAKNIGNPGTVLSNTTAFSYYSNNTNTVSNEFVPDAQNYPFKRTIFKSDGTGRVEEESGVGQIHSIAGGRTTKMDYAKADDAELILVFGEEAPYRENVLKTITTDQNNVKSITYTSKEGKVIATCLTSTDVPNTMAALTRTAAVYTFTDSSNENVGQSGGRLVNSNRIAIYQNGTVIKLKYQNTNLPPATTVCPSGDCNMRMRFFLVDLKGGKTYLSDANTTAGITDFTVSGGFSFPNGWRFVSESATLPATIIPSGAAYNEITLNAGEYIIGKELFSNNKQSYTDSVVNNQNDKFRPILEALGDRMKEVNSADSYTTFTTFLAALKTDIDNYRVGGGVTSAALIASLNIDPTSLPAGYTFPMDFTLAAVSTTTNDAETDDLKITTGCCGTLKVPMPRPSACYACEGSPEPAYQSVVSIATMTAANAAASPTVNTPYGFEDFKSNSGWNALSDLQKRTAIYKLVDREFIQYLKYRMAEEAMDTTSGGNNDLWKIAPGFSYHSLNFMISNMLISRYYTGSAISHSNTWYAAQPGANGGYTLTAPVSSLSVGYNYECKKIYEAWLEAADLLNGFELDGDINFITEFNDQSGDNAAQDGVADDENWDDKHKRLKKKLKKALNQELDEFSASPDGVLTKAKQESTSNFISTFLNYAGYQFAAIIDGSPLPTFLSASNTAIPDDYVSFSETPFGSGIYGTVSTGTINNTNVPYLFTVNNGSLQMQVYTCNTNTFNQLYYPYILKPEWMFKYYVYNVYENNLTSSPALNFISDYSTVLPQQMMIDLNYYYNSPYSYLPAAIAATLSPNNLCKTRVAENYSVASSSYTMPAYMHINWTANERLSFYENVGNAPRCYTTKGLDVGTALFDPSNEVPECATKAQLIVDAQQHLSDVANAVMSKKAAMRTALVDELASSCYTVVACKTVNTAGVISEAEIDVLVQAAIDDIMLKLNSVANSVNGILISMPPSNTVACSGFTNMTSSYSNLMCDMPGCAQEDCKEILLYRDNTVGITSSRNIFVKLFADCDQKLLDMMEIGTFLPKIPALEGCTKAAKIWDSCGGSTTCGADYAERTGCPPSGYEKYSKTYSVNAGN